MPLLKILKPASYYVLQYHLLEEIYDLHHKQIRSIQSHQSSLFEIDLVLEAGHTLTQIYNELKNNFF